ncbi:PadR family transcriptional regulator [Corynebacterium ulcerans]|uniref:PadR family transcriptional regulator n=1 Tax=Corynebacterium ulcerans TaxID=65058 RepID=UPI003D6F1B3C
MTIRHSLLSLLAAKPRPVGELRTQFHELTQHTWPLNIGQVFQTIQRLERDGFVESLGEVEGSTGHTAQVYGITAHGRDELETWWSTPTLLSKNQRDELVIKIAMAQATNASGVGEMVQRQREAVMWELRDVVKQKIALAPQRTAARLLLERRIFNLEAESRWLDHIETLEIPAEGQQQ